MNAKHCRTGLTMLEVLIAMAILGILAALLIPAVQSARAASRRAACLSKLRQIGLAAHNYSDSQGVLPPSAAGGHFYGLLPYLDLSPTESSTSTGIFGIFHCPADTSLRARPT